MVRRGDNLNAKEVGERIKRARLEADGMTQRELAELVGVTERSVAEWERGGLIPYRYMHRLEEILERPAAWILYGENHDVSATKRLEEKLDLIIELLQELQKPPPKGGGSLRKAFYQVS